MDGKAGTQVASPFFQHQLLSGRFYESSLAAKRCAEPAESPWTRPNWQQQDLNRAQDIDRAPYEGSKPNWNANMWEWDSMRLIAKPAEGCVGQSSGTLKSHAAAGPGPFEVLRLGFDDAGSIPVNAAASAAEQKRKLEETTKPFFPTKDSSEEDEARDLDLKLGGSSYSYADDANSSRQNKRVRQGSPGSSYPMCQVDDCRSDLTGAKDYHRRHKVCEAHSKASKALVGNLMQRFCQQCSRFHPLTEFDEGKRSCRRRLAGHNRRRRKTQPDDALSRGLLAVAASQEDSVLGNLINILSRLQGNNSSSIGKPPLDRDNLVQTINKIISASSSGKAVGSSPAFDLNVAQGVPSPGLDIPKANGHQLASSSSTTESLAILSALTGSSTDALTALLGNKVVTELAANFKGEHQPPPSIAAPRFQENNLQTPKTNLIFGSGMINGKTNFSPLDRVSERTLPTSLPLQLFNSADRNNSTQNGFTRKYFSSDSSNPNEEISPSSSPPLVQKLFPLQSGPEGRENDSISVCKDDRLVLNASPSNDGCDAYNLSKVGGITRSHQNFMSRSPFQGSETRSPVLHAGYTSSSSGSDQSPASSNSDSQERTGRIIFKLFGKDPSNFPLTLRSKILEWLSHCPSDMEGYIRPGCVILSMFVAMPFSSWEQLREDLQERMKLLVEDPSTDFWRTGRVLVQAEQQLASFNDGKFRLCRSWRTWSSPEIYYVQPLAVVAGQETTLTLRGHHLIAPGTKILCAYRGKYVSKEVLPEDNTEMSSSESLLTDHRVQTFTFSGGPSNVLGRCFIEVEHGLKGNSFPVIVADPAICRELQSLEREIEDELLQDKSCLLRTEHSPEHSQDYSHMRTPSQDYSRARAREEVVNFLNELGWLFQKSSRQYTRPNPANEHVSLQFSCDRFKSLFIYAVERDWCALGKKLLDIFFEMNAEQEVLAQESSKILLETNPLHRAVKRKCRPMVDLLLNYDISANSQVKCFIFHPNLSGPGGLTPLHLAAGIQSCEVMVDALTSDPQDMGLHSWNTALDSSGQTPYAYALMRGNHLYNRLVERKLADRKNAQVSITIMNTESASEKSATEVNVSTPRSETVSELSVQKLSQTCGQCVSLSNKRLRRVSGNKGILYRPYVHSVLAIAAVCVCVCLLFKGPPQIGSVAPFKWENVDFGPK
uniref:SBP-type domain-containing protein n=1 Tax=Araucaria cunninghamii TaxID=56994 RepID=A0A0D6QW43_ARACU